jgi:F1F0 ATPase subunit 2
MMLATPLLARIAVFLLVGLALGAMHFLALRLNTMLYLAPERRGRALALHALRMALIVAALLVVARLGAAALVAAFVGLIAARYAVAARVTRSA